MLGGPVRIEPSERELAGLSTFVVARGAGTCETSAALVAGEAAGWEATPAPAVGVCASVAVTAERPSSIVSTTHFIRQSIQP